MTPAHLQALRRLLFFSIEEAARMIGAGPQRPEGVAPRAWQYWERGERAVPEDVAATVLALVAWRSQALATATAAIQDAIRKGGAAPADIVLVWYASAADWMTLTGRTPPHWRPHCSVIAELVASLPGVVRIVPFDARAYARWLGRRRDGEQMRAQWAARLSA